MKMKIGVIGGNGVAATVRLCDMVECKITRNGAFRDAHHPEMIVWQATNAPSRSMFLEGRGPDWRPDYIRIAKSLKQIGCTLGCMCCNTAHYAVDDIERASGLRFINLLNEVVQRVSEGNISCVELFCSDGARKHGIYDSAFNTINPKVRFVYPSEERQQLITRVICAVKTKGRFVDSGNEESPLRLLRSLIRSARCPVVLGCTDLRVAYGAEDCLDDNVAVDSLECLADVIVREYYSTAQGRAKGL